MKKMHIKTSFEKEKKSVFAVPILKCFVISLVGVGFLWLVKITTASTGIDVNFLRSNSQKTHLIVIKTRNNIDKHKQDRFQRWLHNLDSSRYDVVLMRDITSSEKDYTKIHGLKSINVNLAQVLNRFPILDDYLYHMNFSNGIIGSSCCGRPDMWQLFRPPLHLNPDFIPGPYLFVWIIEDDFDIMRNNQSILIQSIEEIDQTFNDTDLVGISFTVNCMAKWGFVRHTPEYNRVILSD